MQVQVYDDLAEFAAVAMPFLAADPVRHAMALSVLRGRLDARRPADKPPVLVTAQHGGDVVAVALRTPPWPLLSSGVPRMAARAIGERLVEVDPALGEVYGPRDSAEPFAAAWTELTGGTAVEGRAMRLHRLGTLTARSMDGAARPATAKDIPLLTEWREDFEREAGGGARGPAVEEVRRGMALGHEIAIWQVDGAPVGWAQATQPEFGVAKVGPVYTAPDRRGRGYGSAVTAAVTQWALDRGARDVVLFTDLANSVSNAIYYRLGFRPVHDAVELSFRA